jgi:hypothetical protein
VEEVGSSGKIRSLEKVVLVLLAVEAGAITACAIKVRVLEADPRCINLAYGTHSVYGYLSSAEPSRELVVLGL